MKWIDIKEKVPEDGIEVLVAIRWNSIPVQVFKIGNSWYGSSEVTDVMQDGYVNIRELDKWSIETITHWHPLPDMPIYE